MQNLESRPTCKFHIENSVQRSLRALTKLQAREFASKLLLGISASLLSLACSADDPPKSAALPASEFKISVKEGREPVCTAYAKRLQRTPLRRALEEKDGRWLNNPHCDRGESASPEGFEFLHRVPLSIAEVTRLQPQVDAFLRSPTGSPNTVGRPDSAPVNPVVGSAEWRQTTAIKAGDHFYFYRFQPKVDIDNDGRPDDVIVWKWWGGLCGEPDEGGKPRVLRTDILVLNENGDLDMMRTRRIVGHPKGPVMVIQDPSDPSHPSEVMDTEFRSIGKTMGVFVYRGVTYFDTFYEVGGDLENRRDGTPNYLNTLAVLRHRGEATSLVCEILVK